MSSLSCRAKSTCRWAIRTAAGVPGRLLPLSWRLGLVTRLGRSKVPGSLEFSIGMLDDLRQHDPNRLHRFLWSNHLAYAASYEVRHRFGTDRINPTRHLLFQHVVSHLHAGGIDPRSEIGSVFEVGCSMGYLLRHLEAHVFPSAGILHGIDIDRQAIEAGMAHLRAQQSRVQLFASDMAASERVMGDRMYDLVLCCGVLMYVDQQTAEQVVRTMFAHARRLVGLVCLAHPDRSGATPAVSQVRESDGVFIHNMDRMIREANGRVVSSTWVGTSTSGSSPSHVILAEPQAA